MTFRPQEPFKVLMNTCAHCGRYDPAFEKPAVVAKRLGLPDPAADLWTIEWKDNSALFDGPIQVYCSGNHGFYPVFDQKPAINGVQ